MQVVPADSQSEPLIELWEDCIEGRHTDLDYPQFSLSDDSEMQLLQSETNVPKKVRILLCAHSLSLSFSLSISCPGKPNLQWGIQFKLRLCIQEKE